MNKIPNIPQIDIASRMDQDQKTLSLMREKLSYIKEAIQDMDGLSFEWYDLQIQAYHIVLMLEQNNLLSRIPKNDPPLMQILIAKLAWLEEEQDDVTFYLDKIKVKREIFLTRLYIAEGYFGADTPQVSADYEEVLRYEMKLLMASNDKVMMPKIDRDIRIFYIKEELIARSLAGTVRISREMSDSLIDNKLLSYNEIFSLLRTKRRLLTAEIEYMQDGIAKIDKQIALYNLKAEIASKEDFNKRYRERKNILP